MSLGPFIVQIGPFGFKIVHLSQPGIILEKPLFKFHVSFDPFYWAKLKYDFHVPVCPFQYAKFLKIFRVDPEL